LSSRAPALGGGGRQLLGGLGGGQVGAGLDDLLVQFRRVDLGQQLAGLHMAADVDVPLLEIAGDAGVDGGGVEGLDGRRQRQPLFAAAAQLGQGDGGHLLGLGPGLQRLVGLDASEDADPDDHGGDGHGGEPGDGQRAA